MNISRVFCALFAVRCLTVVSVYVLKVYTGVHLMIKNLLGINCYTETTDETQFQMGSAIGRESRRNE